MEKEQEEKRELTEKEIVALSRLSQTIHLHDALTAIQTEMKAPKDKQQKNEKGGGYFYRSAESILEAVKPFLAKYRLTLTLKDEVVLIGERYYNRTTVTLGNGVEVIQTSFDTFAPEKSPYMSEQQTSGSTASYGRKYALQGLFALDDNQDPDGAKAKKVDDTKASPEIIKWLTNALNQMPDVVDQKTGQAYPAGEAFLSKYKVKALVDMTQSQAEKAKDEITKKAAAHKNANPA